jgi:hypothetical protein
MEARMATKRRSLKTNTLLADAMPADTRRVDPRPTRPDELPDVESGRLAEDVVEGGTTPRIDGGVGQHPVHDEDREDATSSDYEREIDRLDQAARSER